MDSAGKIALVSGGASGLGEAAAERLPAAGTRCEAKGLTRQIP